MRNVGEWCPLIIRKLVQCATLGFVPPNLIACLIDGSYLFRVFKWFKYCMDWIESYQNSYDQALSSNVMLLEVISGKQSNKGGTLFQGD